MINITLITAIVGAVCGVSGAILGIINTCHQLSRNKVRLKVLPRYAIPTGSIANSGINFGIEVVNLSEFPVTITDVGFLLTDNSSATLFPVMSMDQPSKLPVRLEPRTSYSKHFNIDSIDFPKGVKCAYAATQCGERITGTSKALEEKIKEANA